MSKKNTYKDMIIDFLNMIFAIMLISGIIIYIVSGDNFEKLSTLFQSLSPIGFFGVALMTVLKFRRIQFKKRERDINLDLILKLSFSDKMFADIFTFSIPLVIILLPLFKYGQIFIMDMVQGLIILLFLLLWHKYLFSKEDYI